MAVTNYSQTIKIETKNWITQALFQLLAHKDFPSLTVSEVAKKAGVSRMAFYRHFDSLEAVLLAYYEPKFADIFAKTQHKVSEAGKLADLTYFFESLTPDFKLAIQHRFTPILFQIFEQHITEFYDQTTTWSDWIGTKRTYWIHFMSAGLFDVWLTWIKNGQQESLADMMSLIKEFHE